MANNDAVRRSHKIVDILASFYLEGLSNKELANRVRTSAVNISRDMKTLHEIGYAKKLENGNWALTARPLSVMQSCTQNFEKSQQRIQESSHNIYAVAAQLAAHGRI